MKAFLGENSLPPIYSKVTDGNGVDYNINVKSNFGLKDQVLIVKDIPDYLNIHINKQLTNFVVNRITTLKGHFIELHSFKNIADYLKSNFGTKSRSNLRRYQNRLETCFNIKYIVYYGSIEKQEYNRLFITLKDLLIRRFKEKKEANYELQHLEEFQDVVYDLILNKKANLFVIYDGNKPISIRINMHKKALSFYILSGFDIDYSKFHLGTLDMLKNIEWCIDNDFEIYDLLKGYDYYKKKWATKTHYYYNHIIYNSNSINLSLIGKSRTIKENIKYKCYNVFKKYYLDTKYKEFKKSIYRVKNTFTKKEKLFKISDFDSKISNELIKIDIEKDGAYAFLRKPVYDFLFINNESTNNVTVSKFVEAPNRFQIKSKTKYKLLEVIN
ncbi:GNAT family N-acetyltransferase [Flavivirga amylovorans]|uniref:GNAT family N-acetyltransferase n=1 Tax=Flavivirga amylovorans TaxID=870486 RepID=A0ABT8X1U4_9FLAO|nr:GNAT family N-acetyltransferase [Flavivirga amylovorans]MDO5987891.1 GNAT family N-acetyltransferase [Flavivirga amylovorans]